MKTYRIVILILIFVFGGLFWFSLQKKRELNNTMMILTSKPKHSEVPQWWNSPDTEKYTFGYGVGEADQLNLAEVKAKASAYADLAKKKTGEHPEESSDQIADKTEITLSNTDISNRHNVILESGDYKVYVQLKIENL